MRFLRRSLVGLFLFAATLGIFAYAGQTVYSALETRWAEERFTPPAQERVFAVDVVRFTPETVTPVLTGFGEVRARRTLDVRATAGGTVTELAEAFEEGGRVEAGQLLFRVDQADANAALDVARTDLAEAVAELADAERAVSLARDELAAAEVQLRLRAQATERQRNLLDRGVVTEAAIETAELAESAAEQAKLVRRQALATAESRIELARTGVARREIALAEAERRRDETEVHAEFTGVLSEVSLVEGGLVQINQQVARLIDPDALEVSFRVSTAEYARLLDADGRLIPAEVVATLDVLGVDLTARGRISREGAAVAQGQTGRVLFTRLDTARGFRPGDFVTVRIEEPALRNVALLPAAAVDAAGTVLVVDEDDRLSAAAVEVIRRQGDDIIVRAPDLTGARVVAARSPVLGAGIKVRPVEIGTAAVPEAPELVELTEERRARLVAFIENNRFMPDEAKARVLGQLRAERVPAQVVERIESRMGG